MFACNEINIMYFYHSKWYLYYI